MTQKTLRRMRFYFPEHIDVQIAKETAIKSCKVTVHLPDLFVKDGGKKKEQL